MIKNIFSILIVFVHHVCQGQISKVYSDFEALPILQPASVSICIIDSFGHKLFGRNENKLYIPASCLKVVTTASALEILGEDFQFKTVLSYSGKIENGILKGDLYITGGGDPTLGSKHFFNIAKSPFQIWVDQIKKLNIEEIQGTIYPDVQYFSDNAVPSTWLWEDIGNYYGTAATALNYQDNAFEIVFNGNRKKSDSTNIIDCYTIGSKFSFQNKVIVSDKNKSDDAYIFGGPNEFTRIISGSIPSGEEPFKIKGAIPNPPYTTAFLFNNFLEKNQINTQFIDSIYFENRTPIHTIAIAEIQSPPLKDIVYITNQKSNNLYAECLLKTMGKTISNDGSTQKGIEAEINYWNKKGLNINPSSIYDGSGLSRLNTISTYTMSTLMHQMMQSKKFSYFLKSLPISGVSGTLSNLCHDEICKGKIIAKSGTMDKIVSYTGYVKTKSKGTVSFSIIINNFNGKSYEIRKSLIELFNAMTLL